MLCYKNENIFNHVERIFSKTYEMNFVNINCQKLYDMKIDVKIFFLIMLLLKQLFIVYNFIIHDSL